MIRFFRKRRPSPDPEKINAEGVGDMAMTLSSADLAEDTKALLQQLREKILVTGSTTIGDIAQASRQTASQKMLGLIEEINKRLSPHTFDNKPESTDISTLVRRLQDQLKTRPAPSIESVAEKQAKTERVQTPEATTGTALGGETKPEHATPEAIANPFSLVNIQRGAAMGAVMTKDTTVNQGATSTRRRNQQTAERATVTYKKKLIQPRFSRRRFLRDYRGTNLLTVILLFMILLGMNIGTTVTNVSVLIPQTAENQRAGAESQTFLQVIERDQPKLSSLLKRRQKMNDEIDMILEDFSTVSQIREDFANFIGSLDENPSVNLISQQISEETSELPNVSLVTVTLELETSFLLWLRLRNKMVREVTEINISDEVINAPPGVPQINIVVTFSKPGRSK